MGKSYRDTGEYSGVGGGGQIGGGGVGGGSPMGEFKLPSRFIINKLTNLPGKGWVAHIGNLPQGYNIVPLPFTSNALYEDVAKSLQSMGNFILNLQ